MHLRFDGRWLQGLGLRSAFVFPAVSGKPDARGRFDLSRAAQARVSEGPIPEGEYWIAPGELWENSALKDMLGITPRSAWGNYRIAVHPFPSTETYGRGGFFIHGGIRPGSAGCIDLTGYMDAFVQALNEEMKGRPPCYIPLSVRYPPR